MKFQKQCWQRGLEVYFFFGELTAQRIDDEPLTEADRIFIRLHKPDIIKEIKNHRSRIRIEGGKFYGPALMADAVARRRPPMAA